MEYLTVSKLSFFHFYALQATVSLALFLCITNPSSAARLEPQSKTSNTDFVKTSCEVTMYPDICYQSLSAYASTIQTSPRELANTALSVSVNNAQSTSTLTWVSAALTDEDTCMDGIEAKAINGKIKDTIRSNIARVAHLTSNALAFINSLSH
ncbi:21 kDa protein [Hibiscus syriacus]|uniref:21 kDa protein n=1 Tax=Hibiscus syriacus TaxID=106335 RepID=A0A6A2XAK2_HIBSY|nr:21 kDa protein [Hibiscus syriacus]